MIRHLGTYQRDPSIGPVQTGVIQETLPAKPWVPILGHVTTSGTHSGFRGADRPPHSSRRPLSAPKRQESPVLIVALISEPLPPNVPNSVTDCLQSACYSWTTARVPLRTRPRFSPAYVVLAFTGHAQWSRLLAEQQTGRARGGGGRGHPGPCHRSPCPRVTKTKGHNRLRA